IVLSRKRREPRNASRGSTSLHQRPVKTRFSAWGHHVYSVSHPQDRNLLTWQDDRHKVCPPYFTTLYHLARTGLTSGIKLRIKPLGPWLETRTLDHHAAFKSSPRT